MSPIVIFLIDLWIFWHLAKILFFVGFLETYNEIKDDIVKRSSLIFPILGLITSSLWVIFFYFSPHEIRPFMTLLVLAISSYTSGNFCAIFPNLQSVTRIKIVTGISCLISFGLVVIMTTIMSPITTTSLRFAIDLFFFVGIGASFGYVYYQVMEAASYKTYKLATILLAICAITVIVVFVALAIGQAAGFESFRYVSLTLLAMSLIFSAVLSQLIYQFDDDFLNGDRTSRYIIGMCTTACLLIWLMQTIFMNF